MTPKDILQLESTDIRQAYLFEENGHWYASVSYTHLTLPKKRIV